MEAKQIDVGNGEVVEDDSELRLGDRHKLEERLVDGRLEVVHRVGIHVMRLQ